MGQLIFGRHFSSENAAPEGTWVQAGGEIKLSRKYSLYAQKKNKFSFIVLQSLY